MKEWITPILVVAGLLAVGFGIRTFILKRAATQTEATATATGTGGGGGNDLLQPPEQRPEREDPDSENTWKDRYHPFLGFPPEIGDLDKIKDMKPPGTPEHPLDDMVTIPAGEFLMGGGKVPFAGAERKVFVEGFRIDRYEVTNAQYKKFVDASGHAQPELADEWAAMWSWREKQYPKGRANYPVVLVSIEDASAYCAWAGKRLPTEAEWEKAARGPSGNRYPWGQKWDGSKSMTLEKITGPLADLDAYEAWRKAYDFQPPPMMFPVGSMPEDKSPYGVMDMHGNVQEWVADKFKPYEGADATESPLYEEKDVVVVRGAAFLSRDYAAPLAARFPFPGTYLEDGIGFRCAADL